MSEQGKCHKMPKKYCQHYKLTNRREQNKARRLLKHLKRFPADRCAHDAFNKATAPLQVHVSRALMQACPPRAAPNPRHPSRHFLSRGG